MLQVVKSLTSNPYMFSVWVHSNVCWRVEKTTGDELRYRGQRMRLKMPYMTWDAIFFIFG